jgi:predicted metal-binding transcription factor (methanogenesis marker protein 9)
LSVLLLVLVLSVVHLVLVLSVLLLKNRQYRTRRRKTKSANNDVQNTIQKSKDRATRTHWPGNSDCPGELRWSGKISSSCSTHGSNLQNIWIADLEWQGEYMVDVIISREKTTETARYLA